MKSDENILILTRADQSYSCPEAYGTLIMLILCQKFRRSFSSEN